jgi:hypothetical protein
MTVYTPNIPQPGDNPSDSQDQILENFQTLQSLYGTTGDHYSWTNTNATESTKHARVTLPGLPTATAPGNVLPTPGAGNCAIFGVTRSAQTTPYLARDALASPTPADFVNIYPLLPIKAYARLSITSANVVTVDDSFNINGTPTASSSGRNITVTLLNSMRSANYGVLTTATGGVVANAFSVNANTISVVLTGATAFTGVLTVVALES